MEPVFLTTQDVLRIHDFQARTFGGDPAVLNPGLLDAAVAMPRQAFGGTFVHDDLASMAAAYLFHLARNHPFADCNKRTATHAALVFLELNGIILDLPVDETETLVVGVAAGTVGKDKVADFFRALISKD